MRRWVATIATAVLVIVAIAALFVWLRLRNGGRTTTVSAEEALNRYREGAASTTTTVPATAQGTTSIPAATLPTTAQPTLGRLPEPGVYAYTTSGTDGVDALGGARHQYPAVTTLTVSPKDCGVSERWVAAVERWDETTVCAAPGGIGMVHFTGFHRFFGGDSTDDYTCSGEPRPVAAPDRTTWSTTCVAADETIVHHGTVVGSEVLVVGGEPVRTLHVTDVQLNDDPNDQQVTETWYQEGTDLVVRRISRIATQSSSPVGVVHYDETYQIDLQSLVPQR